jgi:hypothetical protein
MVTFKAETAIEKVKARQAFCGQQYQSTIHRIAALPQCRQVLRPHEQPYGSCLPGSSFEEAAEFERLDHLMN